MDEDRGGASQYHPPDDFISFIFFNKQLNMRLGEFDKLIRMLSLNPVNKCVVLYKMPKHSVFLFCFFFCPLHSIYSVYFKL